MLQPRREKYRKVHKGRIRGKASRGNQVVFGEFGLKSLSATRVTARQIEAARVAMTRTIKRAGKIWIRIFPHKSVTKKPAETRMGSGKGAPDHHVAIVRPGTVLFEMEGVSRELAFEAMRVAGHKLPCKVEFVERKN